MLTRRRPIEVRFWEKVDKSVVDGCWNWTGALDRDGYGVFQYDTHWTRRAPRVAFRLAHGREATRLVCHTCDNRRCVNPAHLYDGSAKQNRIDCITRGRPRVPSGETHHSAKYSDEDVRQIRILRALGVECGWIARTFGMGTPYVYALTTGKKRRRFVPEVAPWEGSLMQQYGFELVAP